MCSTVFRRNLLTDLPAMRQNSSRTTWVMNLANGWTGVSSVAWRVCCRLHDGSRRNLSVG